MMLFTPLAVAALVAVLARQPALQIDVLPAPILRSSVTVEQRSLPDAVISGYHVCTDGQTHQIGTVVIPYTIEHELLHAVDCLDNGAMDGSPLPGGCAGGRDCPHQWVAWAQSHRAEALDVIARLR